ARRLTTDSRLLTRSGFVPASRHGGFGRLKSRPRVRAVTERLRRRSPAATQRERTLRNLIRVSVPVDERHIVALDEVRTVLSHFNRGHCYAPKVFTTEDTEDREAKPFCFFLLSSVVESFFNSFSASPTGIRCSTSSSPSCRAAAPSPPPATADRAPCAAPRCD